MRRALAFVVGVGLAFGPGRARAEGADAGAKAAAEALFKDARRLMNEQRWSEACPKLVESQRLDPAAGTLLNLGECFEKNGQTASAWATFVEAGRAADARRRPDWKATAEARARALAPRLSVLVVAVDASARDGVRVTRDGAEVGRAQWGAPIPVDPGPHVVVAEADGRVPFRARVVVGAEHDRVTVSVPTLAPAEQGGTPARAAPEPPPRRDDRDEGDGSARKTIGVVGLAAGGAALATGVVFGVLAANEKSTVDRLCPASPCADPDGLSANGRAHDFATVSTIGFVGAGVLAAAAVAVLLWPSPSRATARLVVTPFSFGGSFR